MVRRGSALILHVWRLEVYAGTGCTKAAAPTPSMTSTTCMFNIRALGRSWRTYHLATVSNHQLSVISASNQRAHQTPCRQDQRKIVLSCRHIGQVVCRRRGQRQIGYGSRCSQWRDQQAAKVKQRTFTLIRLSGTLSRRYIARRGACACLAQCRDERPPPRVRRWQVNDQLLGSGGCGLNNEGSSALRAFRCLGLLLDLLCFSSTWSLFAT
jgi:hypothetical protein